MLRTNQSFLAYIQELYEQQERKENIIVKQYYKGQKLFAQNENATKVMVIKDGITKCFFTENNEKEYIVEFLGSGEIIGEIEFIRQIACLCNIEAMTDVTVYAISPDYFLQLIKNSLQLNNLLLDVFTERIINTSSRASYQQVYTIEYSLEKLLELQSRQEISISKEDMASYLGVTVRSLNRVLKNTSHY
ncbi:Crp/Fnr family transcriptional regulator [Chryseobacterium sp. SSA4.19]|uniref:Crp/Fnr family transcriptional regulator n=1 Tax=Chryseobacterium sp. SSA4.19 TaxID=2919915 RepID=UPI001F4D3E99|nr:Crp/Fnr family transcriptional regulator [Chryseobacterium sp. SSA4.19]MCJ8155027.1 Crp/Fnr family transcriptional regulator [Chryseobacterium sp. SSA4.19]